MGIAILVTCALGSLYLLRTTIADSTGQRSRREPPAVVTKPGHPYHRPANGGRASAPIRQIGLPGGLPRKIAPNDVRLAIEEPTLKGLAGGGLAPLSLPVGDSEDKWNLSESAVDFEMAPVSIDSESLDRNADDTALFLTGNRGACCLTGPCRCEPNKLESECIGLGGSFQGPKTVCAKDICGCLMRACCNPAGVCLGDQTRTVCEGAGNSWHIEASCAQVSGLPLPVCNPYIVNTCTWDNGLPLNDGGASEAHTHSAGNGQLPRYDFNTADDFILRGSGTVTCQIDLITVWMRMQPVVYSGITLVPDPYIDIIGMNVTIFENYVSPITGLNSPAGHGKIPSSALDFNPKVVDDPGGIAYARTHFAADGTITFTHELGYCDPPPAKGRETSDVYRIEIMVDPPILLNKNTRYWLDVQGLFPKFDLLRSTLASLWMPSQRNTEYRGMTQRTGNPEYKPTVPGPVPCTSAVQCSAFPDGYCTSGTSGVCKATAWAPTNMDLVPAGGTTPPQRGNAGNCPGAPTARTRLDYAFQLSGMKSPLQPANDDCANAVDVFNGIPAFDNTVANDDPVSDPSCGVSNQDLWFKYTATCTGVLTATTCDSTFDSIISVFDGLSCLGTELDCDNSGCADDGLAEAVVTEAGQYLIRVGGVNSAAGQGLLTVDCEETCGNVNAGDCCIAHQMPPDPLGLGCKNAACCEEVCTSDPTCCNDLAIGWDQICADAAALIPACRCSCTSTCPGGATLEPESCGSNLNGGCKKTLPGGIVDPCTMDPMDDIVSIGCGESHCGTLWAAGGDRDQDWYRLCLDDPDSDGQQCVDIELSGNVPAGLMVVTDPMNFVTPCLGNYQILADLATASCVTVQRTVCLPAPASYVFVLSTFEARNGDHVGKAIFHDYACGGQNDYTLSVACGTAPRDAGPATGACCACAGNCTDGISEGACLASQGVFAGPGTDCGNLPPEVDCAELAHGCATAQTIVCGQSVAVDLSLANHLPDEPHVCQLPGADPNDSAWISFRAPCADDDGDATATCSALGVCAAGGGPCSPGSPCGADDCNDEGGPDLTSVRVDTSNSVGSGRDSILSVFGTSCPPSGMCASGAACVPGTFCGGQCCGGGSLQTASCADDGCGFSGLLSDACVENLIEGESYLIEVSNAFEPINGVYFLRLQCPCTGSCCDSDLGICTDNVLSDQCAAPAQFNAQFSCAELALPCGQGACCEPDGGCTDTDIFSCLVSGGHPNPGAQCGSILCNPHDNAQCDYSTGILGTDEGTFGFRSQYRPDVGNWTEIADDFELKDVKIACSVDADCPGTACIGGDGVPGLPNNGVCAPDNNCQISDIVYVTFHTDHDTNHGCEQGGLGTCADDPSDYDGIIVTISNDLAGEDKGPTCQPDCDGVNCIPGPNDNYHTGDGCVYSVPFALAAGENPPTSGNYWVFDASLLEGRVVYHIRLHFDPPLELQKNVKHWLAISAIVDEIGFYDVNWLTTANFNGNPSQAYANTIESLPFAPTAFPNDQLFNIVAEKQIFGCGSCQLYGDHVGDFCTVDVGDLLCVLDRFAGEGACGATCTSCDQAPCGGDGFDDVGDILAELDAFSGIPLCADPCPPGGCILPDTSCIDGFTPGGGSSETSCQQAGGSYCGDYTLCGIDCP